MRSLPDLALRDAAVEAVAGEVIQAVHVQLAADELVKEWLGVVVVENLDGQVQGTAHLFVQPPHDQGADVFVVDSLNDAVFQGVAEWAVPHVMEKDGQAGRLCLGFGDLDALVSERLDGFLHQVHAPHRVMKAVVHGARIDQMRQPELRDSPEPLHEPMVHQIHGAAVPQRHEPIHGVIENFVSVDCRHGNTKSVVSPLLCRTREAVQDTPPQDDTK